MGTTPLYCVNCGKVVMDNYNGELLCLTHCCRDYPFHKITRKTTREQVMKVRNFCTVFATETDILTNASLLFAFKLSFFNCKECESREEHATKMIKSYLGDHYEEFTPDNPKIAEYKRILIEHLKKIAIGFKMESDNMIFV